ncbi:MAG: 2-polyprenyl-3-methyl-6-methoxy-1,4-benzoquinone monooxygenase [Gammaproteobacteria bacterium]|nr:2-polyprenyl-3-methyl-6-methoxy-1,4-benzoquinone monooxygenase [Gammaproteobacteria bacterium]
MPKPVRHYTPLDKLCLSLDQALRAIAGKAATTERAYPAAHEAEPELTAEERKHAASLMRINHAGEVSAQALYHGQGLVTRHATVSDYMQKSATEEGDHLDWCHKRLVELGSHTSYLNPLWYAGSFVIGVSAGLVGDKWSLGFVAETEKQVVTHLKKHLSLLPEQDIKSAKILQQMEIDEAHHREAAVHLGAAELPQIIKKIMRFTSKIMVKTAYWL